MWTPHGNENLQMLESADFRGSLSHLWTLSEAQKAWVRGLRNREWPLWGSETCPVLFRVNFWFLRKLEFHSRLHFEAQKERKVDTCGLSRLQKASGPKQSCILVWLGRTSGGANSASTDVGIHGKCGAVVLQWNLCICESSNHGLDSPQMQRSGTA